MHTLMASAAAALLMVTTAVGATEPALVDQSRRRKLQNTTAITNANIYAAVDACLNEDPTYMVCPNTEYGDAADWDVSGVTHFAFLLCYQDCGHGSRVGGRLASYSGKFKGGSVFQNWDMSAATTTANSAPPELRAPTSAVFSGS